VSINASIDAHAGAHHYMSAHGLACLKTRRIEKSRE
jgi:hypothetical protein